MPTVFLYHGPSINGCNAVLSTKVAHILGKQILQGRREKNTFIKVDVQGRYYGHMQNASSILVMCLLTWINSF